MLYRNPYDKLEELQNEEERILYLLLGYSHKT